MYILSIIVPTKNRYKYLYSIIELFVSSFGKDVELVIQDNSDNNVEIIEYLSGIKNDRIVYNYSPGQLAVTENFDKGIQNSHGKYVTMLGDDDIVSTRLTNVAYYMDRNGIDSAIFNKGVYKWPDALNSVKKCFWSIPVPSLLIRNCSGQIRCLKPLDELKKVMFSGAIGVGHLPEVYHGIVSRVSLSKIFDVAGTFFPGPSPDMAIAVALSLTVSKHIFIDAPFTCSGQSVNSAGGKGMRREHSAKLEDVTHLPSYTIRTWDDTLPKIWSPQTIYADSLFYALKTFNYYSEYIRYFDYVENFASLIHQYPILEKITLETAKSNNIGVNKIRKRALVLSIRKRLGVLKFYISRLTGLNKDLRYNNIPTSFEAVKYLDHMVDSLNIQLQNFGGNE